MPLYDENGRVIGQIPGKSQPQSKSFLASLFEQPDRFLRGISELTNRALGNQKDQFLTRQEAETYKKNPVNILKDAAGYASFFTGNPLTAGALQGFGGTYGQDDLGQTLLGTATGAGTGLATGAIGKGIAKILNKEPIGFSKLLGKAGEKIEKNVVSKSIQPSKFAVTGIQDAEKLGERVADKIKNRLGYVDKEALGPAYQSAVDDYKNVISSSKALVDTKPIADEAFQAASRKVDITKGVGKNNVEFYNNRLNELGDKAPTQALSELKFQLQGDLSNAYKKIARGNPLTKEEKVLMSYHDAVDKSLKKAVPEAKEILTELSDYHLAAPDVIKAFNKGESLPVPATFGKVNIPLGNVKDKAQAGFGRFLQKLGPEAGTTPVATSPSKVASILKNPKLASLAPILLGAQGGSPAFADGAPTDEPVAMADEYDSLPQRDSVDNSEVISLLQQGLKPSEVAALQNIGAIAKPKSQKDLSVTDRKTIAQAQSGAKAVADIAKYLGGDQSLLLKSNLPGVVQDSQTKQYQSAITTAKEQIGRLQSGGAISDEEGRNFLALLPSTFDDPVTARQKLERLNEQFGIILGAYQ